MQRVFVYTPVLGPEEARAVALAVERGDLSGTRPPIRELEHAFAEACGMPHGVAVSSGTAALELAVAALGLGPGDEVLCPAATIISCARAIVLAGATPVLVDVEPDTYCIDVAHAAERVTSRTRAVLAVHAFGHPYDHQGLSALTQQHGLSTIEDAAQAHGASSSTTGERLMCGAFGTVSTFSFYANKPVTTGEGGMVLCRDHEIAEHVRDHANLCFGSAERFLHRELGHNYRLSSIQAALGLAQLGRLPQTITRKRQIAALYRAALAETDELVLQAVRDATEPIFWMVAGVLAPTAPLDAAGLAAALARRGIETRPFFRGLHEQPALLAHGLFEQERYPVTEHIAQRGLILPSGLDLDEATVSRVVSAVRESLAEARAESRAFIPAAVANRAEAYETPSAAFGALYAEAYDAFYANKDYAGEIDVVERCFARYSTAPVRRVLDLGCGTGRHSSELAVRGYEVVGVDRSAQMLDIARRRAPELRFVQSSLESVTLEESFDAALMMFAVLSYRTSAAEVLAALHNVRRHLRVGAVLVGDVWYGSATSSRLHTTRRVARAGDVEWTRVGRLRRFPLEQRVEVRYELTRRQGEQELCARELHALRWFYPGDLAIALAATGFELARLSSVDDLERPPSETAGVALFAARALDAPAGVGR